MSNKDELRRVEYEVVNEAFKDAASCPNCKGKGILPGEGWEECPECHGTGNTPRESWPKPYITHKGWFHMWKRDVVQLDGEGVQTYINALIETEAGDLIYVDPEKLRFADQEPDREQYLE